MDKMDIDQKNKKLKELSERDDLTGLYNRRTIYLRLTDLIKEAEKTKKNIYLGILDLDHFKEINDRYGHLYGDEVLKTVAGKILENIREEDIAGRYGGDEFVIILYEVDYESAGTMMKKLLQEVNELDFDTYKLSFSCGIAAWNGESSEELFERADAYMYHVKKLGKNDIQIERT
ncbi:MAG TPA: GGDEF domain-containing protein [Lachnospiraceae bacterium]|nr:GGDEF domain-containing protein [Lachnospiraceae bacterium]